MRIFWNAGERRLRAGWRIVLQCVLMIALGAIPILLVAEPLTALHRRGLLLPGTGKLASDRAINLLVGPLLTLAILASVAIATKVLDRRGVAMRIDPRALLLGLTLGAALMTLVFAVELSPGWIEIRGFRGSDVSLALALSFSIARTGGCAQVESGGPAGMGNPRFMTPRATFWRACSVAGEVAGCGAFLW